MPIPSRKRGPTAETGEEWLTTYADAITLLMAFFVMLLTFAEFDVPAYEEAAAAIKDNIGHGEKEQTATQSLKLDIEDVVYEMQADQAVAIKLDKKGIVIDLSGGAFFKPASAELHDGAIPVLDKITQMINAPKFKFYNIEVYGHTDDEPIRTAMFPSNWELSSSRASTVVRFFQERELEPVRMRAIGMADTDPKVPNHDLQGNPIPENRATNRRVTIRVFPMNLDDRDKYNKKADLKSMLQDVKKNNEQNQAQ